MYPRSVPVGTTLYRSDPIGTGRDTSVHISTHQYRSVQIGTDRDTLVHSILSQQITERKKLVHRFVHRHSTHIYKQDKKQVMLKTKCCVQVCLDLYRSVPICTDVY